MVNKIMFAGGGTGGHIYPALAVAGEIRKKRPETEILFVAGTKGIERSIFESAGYATKTIPVIGLPRKVSPKLAEFTWQLTVSIMKSRKYIRGFKPSALIATGGYVAGPPIIAAHMLGVPIVIQEQNSFPGITNRKLARYADIVFLGFQEAGKYIVGAGDTIVSGNPVRDDLGSVGRHDAAGAFGLDPALVTLLVFGGSQGSHALNEIMSRSAETIAGRGFQVLWQSGRNEFEAYSRFDSGADGRIRVLPYINDMVSAYAASDVVASRAGAMTIAEITACGLPAVFIPLPTAAANHQEKNAVSLVSAGAAEMIREKDLTAETFERVVLGVLESDEKRASMAEASAGLGKKDAAVTIADTIIERYGSN